MKYCDFYVYAYLREDKTPYYIGKGRKNRAFLDRGRCVSRPKDLNRILFLKKNLSEEKAFEFEKYMIFILGRKDLGTGILRNMTNGGEGVSGYLHTEETKHRIAKSGIGRTHSEETRLKLSKAFRGKPISEKTQKASIQARKGKPLSEETRRKISESRQGIPAHNKGKTGGALSEETRRKMSEARRGRPSGNAGMSWFVNKTGETLLAFQSPSSDWQRGRKWK